MENTYIKSPLNYVGGKYKLLKDIIPLFPEDINAFVDLFGGGFNIGINVKAAHVIYNDISSHVTSLLEHMSRTETSTLLGEIDSYIDKYSLTKENKEGYLKLREDYNTNDKSPMKFYTLLCYAFNNQIRFNNQGLYNMPFGKDRSSFNPTLREKFIIFSNQIHSNKYSFKNEPFKNFDFSGLSGNDFVYADPPYFNSVATYNEKDGWTEDNEKDLLNILDELNGKGVRFALSNNLKYDNPLLDKWKDKYNVNYINHSYSNCNYQKKDKSKDIEVLITNYTK